MKRALSLFIPFVIGMVFLTTGCQPGSKDAEVVDAKQESTLASVDLSTDRGGQPWVLDIEAATLGNEDYRVAAWTGNQMQLVFMRLQPGEIIDLELHDSHDQFIRVEEGDARVRMGLSEDALTFDEVVYGDWAILIPAGYWHTVENIGNKDLKLYTIYAPAEHPAGTVHATYQIGKEAHHHHD